MWLLLLGIGTVIVLIYIFIKDTYKYWSKRGLDTPKYHFFLGNLLEQFLFNKNTALIMQDSYKSFEGYNYIGFYNAMQPAVLIRNREIIGDILVKDFASFCDNDFDIEEKSDPIFGKNPFILKGQRWKQARGQATPSFTAGKIKIMMPLIQETCTKLQNYLKDNQDKPLELFTLAKMITSENVSTCAFGLEGNSFIKRDAQFVEICNQLIKPTWWNILKGFMIFLCPSLARIYKVRFCQVETVDYLRDIIEQAMKYRVEHDVQRNDFLDEMKRLKEKVNDENVFNIEDILGHAGGFLLDGILTSSSVVSYIIYSVANNPEVQEKLRDEIQELLLNNNQLTYDNIQDLDYLDCVFKESLRHNPPLMYMMRRVTKPYVMKPMREDDTGPRIQLEVGTPVIIPTLAIHRDEKYFEEPDKFNPERFNKENKDKIKKNSFLPFGDGPRVCLGMKFGVLQTKMALVSILTHFRLTVSTKTKQPLEIDPMSFLNIPVGGHWVDFTQL